MRIFVVCFSLLLWAFSAQASLVQIEYDIPERPYALVEHAPSDFANNAERSGPFEMQESVCYGDPNQKAACFVERFGAAMSSFDQDTYCRGWVARRELDALDILSCSMNFAALDCAQFESNSVATYGNCGSQASVSYVVLKYNFLLGVEYQYAASNVFAFSISGTTFDLGSYSQTCPAAEVPEYTEYYKGDFTGFTWDGDWSKAGYCGPEYGHVYEPQGVAAPLTELYQQTGGEFWQTQDNWLDGSVPVCDWAGVTCFKAEEPSQVNDSGTVVAFKNVITKLDLSGNPLMGELPLSFYAMIEALLEISSDFRWTVGEQPALGGPLPEAMLAYPKLVQFLRIQPYLIAEYFGAQACYPSTVAFASAFDGTDWKSYRCGQDLTAVQCLEPGTGPSCMAGNPINFRHGLKVESAVDFTGLHGLVISRRYDSHSKMWRFDFQPEKLTVSSDKTFVNYRDTSGRVYSFDCNANPCSIYRPGGDSGALALYRLSQIDSAWVLTLPSGAAQHYNLTGRLVKKVSADGFNLHYSHESSSIALSNDFSQSVTVTLADNGQPQSIETPVGTYVYQYNVTNQLTKVTKPSLDTIEYLYDEPEHSQATGKVGLLTGIIDEAGQRKATWRYDEQGRGIESSHGDGLEKTQIAYIQEGGFARLEDGSIYKVADTIREVINPLGSKLRYYLDADTLKANKIEYYRADGSLQATEWFQYNINGYLLQKTNKNGTVTRFGISNGRTGYQVDGYGSADPRATTVYYLGRTHLPRYVGTPETTTTYQYNARQQLIQKTIESEVYSSQSRTTSYQYNELGLLSAISDSKGNLTQFEYDAQGRRHKIINALGHTTEVLSFNSRGLPLQSRDANGIVSTMNYNLDGHLTSIERNGLLTQYSYDATGKLTQTTLPDGQVINYSYDSAGRRTGLSDAQGNTISYTLDSMGNTLKTQVHDSAGSLVRLQQQTFDSLGQLTELISAEGDTTYLQYNLDGSIHTTIDPLGNAERFEYNALGQIKSTFDAQNNQTQLNPLSTGFNSSVTDAEGKTTEYKHNGFGEIMWQNSPDTGITEFTYDTNGNLRLRKDLGLNRSYNYQYDALNRLVYDETNGAIFTYDETTGGNYGIGKLTSVITANSTMQQFKYDANGNIIEDIQTVEGVVFAFYYQYDSNNRLIQITYPSTRVVNYSYNSQGQVSEVATTYNGQTQVLANNIEYLPFGPFKSFSYGNQKQLTRSFDLNYRMNAQQTTGLEDLTYLFAANNNITVIDDLLNSGNSQSFDYTATSRLVEATGSYGNLTYSYDAIGNRLNKTNNNQSEDYIYKVEDHHLESITGETTTNYTYNAIGQAIQKGDMTFTYGFNGRMQSATNNGETAQYNYDHRNLRVSKLIDTTRTWTAYNPQGQILAEQTQVLGVPRQRHDYDVEYIYLNGQLLSVIQTPIEVFTYGEDHKVDEGHNENSQTGNWTQEKTRKAWGGYHITASGNTGASFTWSKFLLGGTYKVYANWVNDRKNNTQAQYQIQHAGQLETITVDQTQRGEWHLLGTFEFSGEGNEHVTLTDAGGKVSADAIRFERVADLSTEPKIYFAHNNHLSTPTKLTDINGTVVWSADYTPFGLAAVNDDADGNNTHIPFNIRFPGQYYDQETGLHYNWHRYYDPEIGRYIQSDPIGLAGGNSTYGYVSGNPVGFVDPMGLTQIRFERSRGVIIVDPEIEGILPYVITASSGIPGCMCDETEKNKGPIPYGNYYLFAKDLTNPNFTGDFARNTFGDWGDWRAPLKPTKGTKTHGRDGFFIHGGKSPGSAGCIDVGGGVLGNELTNRLLNDILNDPDGKIQIRVRN